VLCAPSHGLFAFGAFKSTTAFAWLVKNCGFF